VGDWTSTTRKNEDAVRTGVSPQWKRNLAEKTLLFRTLHASEPLFLKYIKEGSCKKGELRFLQGVAGYLMRRAEDLLEDSDDFLGAAKDLLLTGRWAKVCFMAQQAAELAVKAALNALGRERRMRSVHKLLEELAGLLFSCEDIAALIDDAKILTSIISRRGT